MEKRTHIILGESSLNEKRIKFLKMNGMDEIIVFDENQTSLVKEKNDVVYLSSRGASLFMKDSPGMVHHLFVYIPPGKRKKKNRTNQRK